MEENTNKNKSFSIGCIEITKRFSKKLGFDTIFNRFKTKGGKLSNQVTGLVGHKLHFSGSINNAAEWLNLPHIGCEFNLPETVPKTYYRVLETIGRHERSIMTLTQQRLFELYNFSSTDSNFDWSSLVLHGCKAELGEYGYSRDHRPDKRQITFGIAQLRSPMNIPFALSIEKGNVPDKVHFEETFRRTLKALQPGSMIVIDRGANTKEIKQRITEKRHHYLCASSLSTAVDKVISAFKTDNLVEMKDDRKIYCHKYRENGEYAYLFFSEKLYDDTIVRKRSRAQREVEDAIELEKKIRSGRKQKAKQQQLREFIAEYRLSLQKRLLPIKKAQLVEMILEKSITGREGFFLLKSSRNLTEKEALHIYRSRDTIEKLIESLKNTIRIKPIRVWTDDAIRGALIIGFLAQLILALMQYEQKMQNFNPRTLLNSLRNLTLTLEHQDDFTQKRIISNFDAINHAVFSIKTRIT